jgi:predicted nucleic acid-binding protein
VLVWAYHQKVSRLKNVAEKLKIRYGKNKTISVRVKGRLAFMLKRKVSPNQQKLIWRDLCA